MGPVARTDADHLLLGEWASLGAVYPAPTHGFAVAKRLRPDGDIGRVWSLSRALTYRSLDVLGERGYIRPVGQEPGIAGPNRTILAATRVGRSRFRAWIATPVAHLRDLRSELLLKLILAESCGIDVGPMLAAQRVHLTDLAAGIGSQVADRPDDVVALWRVEASQAALRFLDRLGDARR